jgi:hypothetical protein
MLRMPVVQAAQRRHSASHRREPVDHWGSLKSAVGAAAVFASKAVVPTALNTSHHNTTGSRRWLAQCRRSAAKKAKSDHDM